MDVLIRANIGRVNLTCPGRLSAKQRTIFALKKKAAELYLAVLNIFVPTFVANAESWLTSLLGFRGELSLTPLKI